MNRTFTSTLLLAAVLCLAAGCKKKLDEYYERPTSLEPPIYQQLQSQGRFKSLLAVIDKSGYKQTLSAAGYWTFFAPNDEAFSLFFKDRGISGVDAIDSATARSIVQYMLIFNAYTKQQLSSYQSTGAANPGWQPASAFRRATSYYTGFYYDTTRDNRRIVAVANNRNATAKNISTDAGYVASDYNNKSINYFTDIYFGAMGLGAADYTYFYPQSQYSGFNVGPAKVIKSDLMAENGVWHEIDRVVTPLMSIDEYIRTRPEYTSFKAILNRLYLNNMIQFSYNADVTHRYQVVTGKTDSVFVKVYSNLLSFAPNNENYKKDEANDAQRNCWSVFIPRNEAVDAYVNNTMLASYKSLDSVPIQVIADFLNSHLYPTAVWPTKFATTFNNAGEAPAFDPAADIFDRKMLSNGMLYGTNKVMEPNVFKSVFGKAYLNPNYQMMVKLLEESGLKLLITRPDITVTIFLISDASFSAAGYRYNSPKEQFEYRAPGNTGDFTAVGIKDLLVRMVKSCVFFEPYRQQLKNLGGSGIVKSGNQGEEGDYISFSNNNIFTAGLKDLTQMAHVDSTKTAINGTVYYINNLLTASVRPIGYHLRMLGTDASSPYNSFWKYVQNWIGYNSANDNMAGLSGTFYTLFVPDNAAILRAVNNGLLPGTGTAPNKTPNFNPSSQTDKDLVQNFIQYHILDGHTAVPDGMPLDANDYPTMLKDRKFNSITVNLSLPGADKPFQIKGIPGNVANIILPQSNNLSNRCVIHLIDNYLEYKLN